MENRQSNASNGEYVKRLRRMEAVLSEMPFRFYSVQGMNLDVIFCDTGNGRHFNIGLNREGKGEIWSFILKDDLKKNTGRMEEKMAEVGHTFPEAVYEVIDGHYLSCSVGFDPDEKTAGVLKEMINSFVSVACMA